MQPLCTHVDKIALNSGPYDGFLFYVIIYLDSARSKKKSKVAVLQLVDKIVTSNFQICFPAPYLILHGKYSHMPNMPRGRTSPGLP